MAHELPFEKLFGCNVLKVFFFLKGNLYFGKNPIDTPRKFYRNIIEIQEKYHGNPAGNPKKSHRNTIEMP